MVFTQLLSLSWPTVHWEGRRVFGRVGVMNIVKLGTRLEIIDIDKYIFRILHCYDHHTTSVSVKKIFSK